MTSHSLSPLGRLVFALLGLLLGTAPLPARAQYYITEHILINDGLSNNYIHDLTLDGQGRLWIATASGLNAYNGVSTSSYNVANSALSANMINCLWYDATTDYLWAGTKGEGLSRIHPVTGRVDNINTPDSTLSNVLCITPADQDHLWLISPKAVMRLDVRTLEVRPIELGEMDQYFRCGVDDGNGHLILGSHMDGASVLNYQTRRLTPLVTGLEEARRIKVNHIRKDHTGRIWLATSAGLWYYVPGSTQLVPYEAMGRHEVFHIEEVDDRELWVTTSHAVTVIDLATHDSHRLQTEGEIELLSGIQCIYQDPHGNIWVGGQGNGLQFISHQPPYFRRIHPAPFWGIYEDDGVTWAGSRGHLYGFEGTECTRHFDLTPQGYGAVLAICGDGRDLLYLAVPYHMLTLDKRTGQTQVVHTPQGRDVEALTFYREADGTLWITATDGVYTLRDGVVSEMSAINQVLNRQSANGIRRDAQGKLWVATYENGLYLFDTDYRLLRRLTRQSGFCTNSVQHLKFDSQGRLWMSTPDGPCCVPDTSQPDHYVCFGYEEGLRDTYVRAIQEDASGNIWMSTNNGISMLRYDERTFVNYSQADYIPVNNLMGGAVRQRDGGIVFTSMDGLCHCYPDSLTRPRQPMRVALMSVVVLNASGQGMAEQSILPDARGVYHLDHAHGSFRLVVGCQDHAQSRLLEFEYQMLGDSPDWIPCTRGMITFRNLQPGQYKINVRARMKGQPWSAAHAVRTTICIDHPWWSSLAARIAYALLVITALAVILQHYKHRLRLTAELDMERRRNLAEQERNDERLRFFTNITHELKTPLTLIQAPLEEMLRDGHMQPADARRLQLVADSTQRLTSLCNKLLDFRRTETHNTRLKVSQGLVGALVEEVGRSYAELNTNPALHIVIQTEAADQPILFDADVIRSILSNLLSNALKYTPEGTIRLTERQTLCDGRAVTLITVSDTGYGIAPQALPHIFDRYYQARGAHQASGTGIGLAIVRSLAELHKATVQAESREGQGTTMTLTLHNDELYPEALHGQGLSPVREVAPQPAPSEAASDDHRPAILLVEDDYPILSFMAEALGSDYRVLQAHNGREGLEVAFSQMPDVIITDLMMPEMDGNTLCRTLKADLRTSHIPIVMLTAKDTTDDQRQGYDDGADSYLTKPFSLQMLRSRLQNLLNARRQLAEWIKAAHLDAPLVHPEAGKEEGVQTGEVETRTNGDEATPAPAARLSRVDQQFLQSIHDYVVEHVGEQDIRMEDLAQSMRISHSTLYRKVKALTGLSGAEYVRRTRITYSAELLRAGQCNVSEAAYRCGFSSLPYFRNAFREVFGMSPSEYLRR